ncbi:protein kinase RIM15 [Aspergillus fischeri NRRL 181]|uniref:non-specific serine/threonine protein kinase n=1 Tax=Neosartorya fischeri (strain ATCC 1020 / DSM 3700 / CBS 544.65 / FGSC A1164 / JCM 1740 / NRRL 181 / WB 181) TaxID=331117 RepID=A1DI60_NEOFI|nr:serine threonine protein kinase, putative [Aspergillus fischeri NRRL 181]EAW19067.1 serine threonine protein kinase, putative [Aspergillus fischeri NRRL 181]
MAGNGTPSAQFLAPPAVTALRQEARGIDPKFPPMTRSLSEDMREEREELKEAAEQTLNVIVDLDLDGRIKWVSPSWRQVVGTSPESLEGRMISDFLVDNKSAFHDAIESMKEDDSRSRFIRFGVRMGPESILKYSPEPRPVDTVTEESSEGPQPSKEVDNYHDVLSMEGQGIMVFERTPDGTGHTMWMLRPFNQPREVTIDLPPLLVESLGVGAEVLANYLTTLAEAAANEPDPSKYPAPNPVLCRICERQITPWWFEKHSDLCLQEHRAEMDVQIAQENLNEHRHAIVKVLDALEARQSRPLAGEAPSPMPQPEYKGLAIGPSPVVSAPSSGNVSNSSSAPCTPPRSREHSASDGGHSRGRSFAVRRPLTRIVELILDLCDTALEINMPVIKEPRGDSMDDFRTLSPQSESRISQVMQWQSPSSNTLEQEQGLAALSADTEQVCKAKVDAVIRHRKIVEYAERIRIEYTVMVEDCIAAALSKAERIAAGQLSDSTCPSEDELPPENATASSATANDSSTAVASPLSPQPVTRQPTPSTSALTMSMRNASERFQFPHTEGRSSSVAVSTGSNSPMECPTPRSHRSTAGLLGTSQPSRRGLSMVDLDAGEMSDSSVLSSAFTGAVRTESPASDRSLERKRRSLVLPGLSSSPRRQPSPARMSNPHSPLRMPKPRLSSGAESLPSPIVSPSTHASELAHYHYRHHRRQSSATSSDVTKPPVSPHLTSASQPQPRPAPPSIKDFEIIKPISKGAFGSVYLSKKKSTGEYFAIKVLKKADMVAKNQVTNVKAERAIMMWQGESDFVAKLYWTFSSKDYLYLVMEYLNGGDCASLVKVLGGLPEDWAKKYIAEVVLGVEHLHSRGIVHRDLKPDNLLIDQKGHLKLTDFGLSRMGLVGRQKRVLKSLNEPAPDLLKQGPFPRATSIASSRSASFDFQAPGSPGSTPLMTPDLAGSLNQPSYFSLNQSGLSRQPSRRASGYRSDSGGSENLSAIFRNFSLTEGNETASSLPPSSLPVPVPSSSNIAEEESQSEAGESPRLYPLQPTLSNSVPFSTPPQQSMMPPLMALFDPEDHNRRFVGTPDYLAPETINGLGQDEMSDWWSLGCIMFEFLFGYPPFNASTPDKVFENILHRRINWPDEAEELASQEAIDLMNRLMTLDPRERIGANVDDKFPNGGAEIRSHPWFSDINWETLLEDKAQFVPNLENPEDTEYFDARGATLQPFAEELEEGPSSQPVTAADRPHDALFKVRSQVNSMKRPLMPLHIPPHVRDSRSRRLSEPALADDFGSFSFKNLPMLEKANKDVIQKLRQEALQAQQRQYSSSIAQAIPPTQGSAAPSGPSLEGSPLPMPLQRTLSHNKSNNRPSSPSSLSQANSSPSRPSQPSSPLLLQFSTGNNHERRKTSGSSSTNSHQSSGSFATGSTDQGRMANIKLGSSASSPIKIGRGGTHSPDKTPSGHRQGSIPTTRARSQTIGSQDGELSSSLAKESYVAGHYKRRSQLFDISPSSSDNEDPRTKALLKVQRRRQSSRRLSQINILDGPFFRPLDVLICEDHPVSRMVMERLFEKLRCRTITAVNGAEAMRYALSEVQFDIIMTEFKLPQVNGADLARMVRETRSANRHTPIIAVTGYLKDLPETHHFDALIQKPPTLTKLTEALCKFCQWKPPPKDYSPSQPFAGQPSALRHAALAANADQSPSSTTSSGFAVVPSSSYRGSSREDSIGSSYFGDMDSIKAEEPPVVVSRPKDEWMSSQPEGLGISDNSTPKSATDSESCPSSNAVPFPHLLHAASAPAAMEPSGKANPRKQRSSESIRAKRQSLEKKRYECAESGDDEDEELGNAHVRTPSSRSRSHRPVSKLGVEMMRTNSRGSVVSGSEELLRKEREALERGKNGESENAIESGEEPTSSSPSTCDVEDRFDRLQIYDNTIEERPEEEISPGHSPLPQGTDLGSTPSAATRPKRPSCSQHDRGITEIYRGTASQSSAAKSSTETLKKGQVTPPIIVSKEDEPSASAMILNTPSPRMSKDNLGTDVDDYDRTADSEATPRPRHTPSPNLDLDHTPRPSER